MKLLNGRSQNPPASPGRAARDPRDGAAAALKDGVKLLNGRSQNPPASLARAARVPSLDGVSPMRMHGLADGVKFLNGPSQNPPASLARAAAAAVRDPSRDGAAAALKDGLSQSTSNGMVMVTSGYKFPPCFYEHPRIIKTWLLLKHTS